MCTSSTTSSLSDRYSHSDFKGDLEKEIWAHAQEDAADMEEDAGIKARASVAQGTPEHCEARCHLSFEGMRYLGI
jgi:hypothetical protein